MEKCDKRAKVQVSISTGSINQVCWKHCISIVRAARDLVIKRNYGVYIQRIGDMSG